MSVAPIHSPTRSILALALAGTLATACDRRTTSAADKPATDTSVHIPAPIAPAASSMARDSDGKDGPRDGGEAAVRAPIPEAVLRSIVGCWRLADEEQWTITRTDAGGARVTRQLLSATNVPADYARRAALPADILYDPGNQSLAFSTAGPHHALLFVFTAESDGLSGSWGSSRAPGAEYRPTGGRVKLRPCGGDGGS